MSSVITTKPHVRFLTKNNDQIKQKSSKKPIINIEDHIPQEKVEKYQRGPEMEHLQFKSKRFTSRLIERENHAKFAETQSAKNETLLTEGVGFIELEEGEQYHKILQEDIIESSVISTAQKSFSLQLPQFGPYRVAYTRNGHSLALAGQKGHVAMLRWESKQLSSEFNVMERVKSICYLHNETMLAVAQKQWTYIYDNQGLELHCLKALDKVECMEFLPYHFLLAASSSMGFLSFLDVSVGQLVSAIPTRLGTLNVMTQNPSNASILLGHQKGSVTIWSPSQKEPLVRMLCHKSLIHDLSVSQDGGYMASAGGDGMLRVWDLRMNYQPLHNIKQTHGGRQSLAFSQRGLLALSGGNVVEIYKGLCACDEDPGLYLRHRFDSFVQNVRFCPFEDVLGVGYQGGVASLIVPGAGEPNIDGLESNPYRTKKQRQNTEVRMLLDKIQPELISIDNSLLGSVEKSSEEFKAINSFEKAKDFVPRRKTRHQSGTVGVHKRKQLVIESRKISAVRSARASKGGTLPERKFTPVVYQNPLDRFK